MTESQSTDRRASQGFPPPASGADDAEVRAAWERLREGSDQARAASGAQTGVASLLAVLEAARGAVPPELERQLTALLRELLLTIRALIDWYLERLDGPSAERRVEDIPIE